MAGGDKNLWIIANWKSNKDLVEALEWISKVGPAIPEKDKLKVAVCPTFTVLEEVAKAVQVGNFPLIVGSQDLSPFEEGPFTGEEPASILSNFVTLSILGHSERRQNFSETDEMVAEKVDQAISNKITPLVCVQSDQTPVPAVCNLVAYEPVFAIGTGHPDTPENADQVAKELKNKQSRDLEVLYGGSVTSANAKSFLEQDSINGLLIGKASLDAEEFIAILNECSKI